MNRIEIEEEFYKHIGEKNRGKDIKDIIEELSKISENKLYHKIYLKNCSCNYIGHEEFSFYGKRMETDEEYNKRIKQEQLKKKIEIELTNKKIKKLQKKIKELSK